MTNLDKITEEILEEGDKISCEILQKAKKEKEVIMKKSEEEGKEKAKAILEKAEKEAALELSKYESSSTLSKKREILAAKQEIISSVINKALEKINSLDDKEYFELILKIIEKEALNFKGEIYFSDDDLSKLPKDFEDKIKKLNPSLNISKETKEISKGFVLVNGGIEENFVFEALINSKKEILQDKINKILFG